MFFGLSNKPEMSRMLWALSVLAGIGYSGAHLIINASFDIMQFGTGMGLLLAGGGAATMMKDTGVARATSSKRDPQRVEVVNESGNPVPVDQK
jgi:hypothetical protein